MLKQALVAIMAVGLMMGSSGCTSKKAADEEVPADVAEVAGEGDGLDAGGTDDVAASDAGSDLGGDELSPDEQLPEDGGSAAADTAATDPAAGDDFATPAEELADNPEKAEAKDDLAAMEPTSEPTPEPTPEPSAAPTEIPPTNVDESLAAGSTESTPPMEEEPKKIAPLRKIADAPYEQNGILVNTVYLARPGDTLDSVVAKIYGGQDKKKELVKLNPTLKTREVKVGDKIYYNSPQRSTDNAKMLTYYEDMGLAPETYVVSKPENIREIAKTLLGDTNSWKELWSTNLDLESKGELAEGTQLRYWAGTPAPTMAQNAPASEQAPPPVDPMAAAPVEQAPPPPPPVEQPPMDQQAMNTPPPDAPPPAEMAPPPPPPPSELPPPPPPPPADTAATAPVEGEPGAMGGLESQDQTMAMAAGAVLLFGAVLIFIMIRKRKARRQIDFHTSTQTQIE